MTLDELILSKRITVQQSEIFTLFHLSELGRKWLNSEIEDSFRTIVKLEPELLACMEGRRSLLRDIVILIENVQGMLNEPSNASAT